MVALDKTNPETVTKSELKTSTVTATFGQDFDFDLPLRVQGFKITIEGEGSYFVKEVSFQDQLKELLIEQEEILWFVFLKLEQEQSGLQPR